MAMAMLNKQRVDGTSGYKRGTGVHSVGMRISSQLMTRASRWRCWPWTLSRVRVVSVATVEDTKGLSWSDFRVRLFFSSKRIQKGTLMISLMSWRYIGRSSPFGSQAVATSFQLCWGRHWTDYAQRGSLETVSLQSFCANGSLVWR